MIGKGLRYAYPIARVRTLLGQLLQPTDYFALLQARDPEAMLTYLRTTAYGKTITAERDHSASFVLLLYDAFFARAAEVIDILPQAAAELCRILLMRYEIEVLKVFLRTAWEPSERPHPLPLLYPLPASSSLPLERLVHTHSVQDIVDALAGTPYAPVVAEAIEDLSPSPLLFPVEVRLDRWVLSRLCAAPALVSGQERRVVHRLFGVLADVTNILWAQRLRTTFRCSVEETRALLLPHGFYLSERRRQALAAWDGQGPLPVFFPGMDQPVRSLRLGLLRTLCRAALRPLLAVPFQAGVPCAYLLLTELEVADLKTVWEGKRWQVGATELAQRLIRFHGPQLLEAVHV